MSYRHTWLVAITLVMAACQEDGSDQVAGEKENAAAKGCGEPALAIRSGELVTSRSRLDLEYQTVGKLTFDTGSGRSLCTANLIAPNVLLTARHCVQSETTKFTSFLFQQNAGLPIATGSKIIAHPSLDVALVQINKNYFTETANYPTIKPQKLPDSYVSEELRMVGFGGYTDGQDLSTFEVGKKRTGLASFEKYALDLSGSFGDLEYLFTLPGGEADEQVICKGDSGSSLFYTRGPQLAIVGVASLGSFDTAQANPATASPEEVCAYALNGLFVPSNDIHEWVHDQIKEWEPNYVKPQSDMLVEGTIDAVIDVDDGQIVLLTSTTVHDSPDNASTNEFVVDDRTKLAGPLRVGREVLIYGLSALSSADPNPRALTITDQNFSRISKGIRVSGTVSAAPVFVELFGRKEAHIKITNISLPEESLRKLPLQNETAKVILCTKGCSQNLAVNIDAIAQGELISVEGDYILGKGFYARHAEGSFIAKSNSMCQP